jgi:hypothetical protein
MNENRILVSVKKIDKIEPLTLKNGETARSVLAFIGGWKATVGATEFNVGDSVVFAEPDSVFPVEERWYFLERHKYRIKTQKYGNLIRPNGESVVSQGLILPMSVLPEKNGGYEIGEDVTKILGVTHAPESDEDEYADNAEFGKEKAKVVRFKSWMPAKMFNALMRYQWFRKMAIPPKEPKGFVREVSKTDEERIQNCGSIVNADTLWTATEKVDGTSSTYRLKRKPTSFINRLLGKDSYDFAVCTRNNRLNTPNDTSVQWVMAKKYKIYDGLKKLIGKNDWVAIQGECAGPKIQKNPQGLKVNRLFVFNLYYPNGRVKSVEARELIKSIGLEWVPIIATGLDLHGKTEEDLLNMANGKSALNPDKLREGIVFRAENPDMDLSFKAVSPEYCLKKGE